MVVRDAWWAVELPGAGNVAGMWQTLLAVLLAIPLSAPFGDAEASALSITDDGAAVLAVSVEVAGAPAAVLVRGVGPVDELPPVALVPRGDGTYAGTVELNTTVGVLLGFEYIPAGGGASILSDLYTLVQLGVDPAALARVQPTPTTVVPPATEAPSVRSDNTRWGWLAVAAGAATLALLAVWLLMGGRERVDLLSGNTDNLADADEQSTAPGPGAA